MARKTKFYVHVNQHNIRYNFKNKDKKPYIVVKRGKSRNVATAFHIKMKGEVELFGNSEMSPILPCGARVVAICDDYEVVR